MIFTGHMPSPSLKNIALKAVECVLGTVPAVIEQNLGMYNCAVRYNMLNTAICEIFFDMIARTEQLFEIQLQYFKT